MATPDAPRGMQPPDKKPVRITVPQIPGKARYGDPFFPKVPFQAIFYILAIFGMLLFLAISSPAPLQDPADPLNHAAIDPKPEWYFMFLFQLLKYFSGPWVPVGTVVIPTILVLLLMLLPWYDRNWARSVTRRPVAVLSMSGGMVAIMFLTWGGFGFPKPIFTTTSTVATGGAGTSGGGGSAPAGPTISPQVAALFSSRCGTCHIAMNSGGLYLNSYQALIAGGNVVKGSVVVPGNHAKSVLWQITQAQGPWPGGLRMPLAGGYLSSAEEATLTGWIDGLKGPGGGTGSGVSAGGGKKSAAGGTAPVSYQKDIQSIFQARCATCHISAHSGGVNLSNYQTMKASAPAGASSIIGASHAGSVLWQMLQPAGPWPGGVRMPLAGGYLAPDQLDKIAAWIDQGAKNN
jgi:mono/diheme cytochrome c family protein